MEGYFIFSLFYFIFFKYSWIIERPTHDIFDLPGDFDINSACGLKKFFFFLLYFADKLIKVRCAKIHWSLIYMKKGSKEKFVSLYNFCMTNFDCRFVFFFFWKNHFISKNFLVLTLWPNSVFYFFYYFFQATKNLSFDTSNNEKWIIMKTEIKMRFVT